MYDQNSGGFITVLSGDSSLGLLEKSILTKNTVTQMPTCATLWLQQEK